MLNWCRAEPILRRNPWHFARSASLDGQLGNRNQVSFLVDERVVAVGLLTQRDLDALGPTFTRAWPVDETPCFSGLLQAIDEADRELTRSRQDSRCGDA